MNPSSEPCGFGQIYAEPDAAALVSACHLGGGVAEVFLDMPLVDLSVASKARAQGIAGGQCQALCLGHLSTDPAAQDRGFDRPRDVFVREAAVKYVALGDAISAR